MTGVTSPAAPFANALQGAVVTTINGVPLYINYRGGDGNDVELTTTQPPPFRARSRSTPSLRVRAADRTSRSTMKMVSWC